MSDVRQVIVVRRDLNMRKGKMCAQAAHASIAFLTNEISGYGENIEYDLNLWPEAWEWIEGIFKKIVVSVNSEEELFRICREAKEAGLHTDLIQDAGLTEFKEPTYTCCAIGPHEASSLMPITGNLPLL